MKNLILILVLFISVIGISQNNKTKKQPLVDPDGYVHELVVNEFVPPSWVGTHCPDVEPNFDEQLVIQEIALLLDSIREYMYEKKVLKTEVDSIGNKGVQHHNKYLKNFINPNKPNMVYLSHNEVKNNGNSYYVGKDTLIYGWGDRMRYFTKNVMGVCGEVCSGGSLSLISTKGLTPKEMAKKIIYGFYHSKEHWDILTYFGYTKIAADFEVRKNLDGNYVYWFTLVVGYNIITTKRIEKNPYYYPEKPNSKVDSFFSMEYYEVVDRKYVFNR
jgi:hypothetical protein